MVSWLNIENLFGLKYKLYSNLIRINSIKFNLLEVNFSNSIKFDLLKINFASFKIDHLKPHMTIE